MKNRKKNPADLQTLLQMNLLGAHQEIIFRFYSLLKFFYFVANKKKKKWIISVEKILNDYIKFNGTTVSRKQLNQ